MPRRARLPKDREKILSRPHRTNVSCAWKKRNKLARFVAVLRITGQITLTDLNTNPSADGTSS